MNDIQKRLKLIDKQLAGSKGFFTQLVVTSPLFIVAIGLAAGILMQNALNLPIRLWLILLVIFVAAVFVLFSLSAIRYTLYAFLAFVCFACLGAIRLDSFNAPETNDIRLLIADEPKPATIRGRILTEPYTDTGQQWQFARFAYTGPSSSFYLEVSEVSTSDGWAEVTGDVRVQVNEPVLDLKAGDYIQVYCLLERFNPPGNPGEFNTAEYLARRGVYIAASVKSRDAIELMQKCSSTSNFVKIKRKLQQTATQALLDSPYPQDQNQGLLLALMLGYRANIDSKTIIAFRKTGLLHFVCLSGMNFCIVIGIIWWLCKTAGLMKPARAVVCIIAAVVFLLVVPSNAPAMRAGIICFVFCASFFFRRSPNSLNSLSLAAIILLLIRPTELFEASWQLSFAAVLGLLLLCELTHLFLYEKITGVSWSVKVPVSKPFYQIAARPGLRLLSTCVTAWLATAGISLYHFYTINWLTSIWTVLVSPLISIISAIGYLKMVIALFLPTAASILGVILNFLAGLLILIVNYIADLNISEILIGKTPAAMIIFYYALVLFIYFAHFQQPAVKKAICTAAILIIIVFIGAAKWQRTHRDNLALTCLDVGHGQAILAQLPGSANVLFDAGSLHRRDIGGRIVVPFLYYSGISKIDGIIISHSDVDHINGIPEIVENCKVGGIYADKAFFEAKQKPPTEFLNNWLNEKGIKIQSLNDGLNLNSPAKIKFIWPDKLADANERLSENDKSTVSLIEFAGDKALLCSDIEKAAQARLIKLFPALNPDVVVVPHHGSVRTAKPDFIEDLQPKMLIYSCDRKQYERLQPLDNGKNKSRSFCTAKDGAITIHIDSAGKIETSTYTK
jgi:competence protein ComEC